MLWESCSSNNDIVKVIEAHDSIQASKHCLHEPLESGWSVIQSKLHYRKLVQASSREQSYIPQDRSENLGSVSLPRQALSATK